MKKSSVLLGMFLMILTIVSCSDDDNNNEPKGDYDKGILIANEGPFGTGSGTVTYLSDDNATIEQTIYKNVNNGDIGNILQSIGFYDDNAYLIANASNVIRVVNRYTFDNFASISDGLVNPRYFTEVNGKGYVTNWGDANNNDDDFIAVLNLDTNMVESTIPVEFGPEEILAVGNTLYIAHQGGYGQNNIISVIDTSSNTVTKTITVGDVPNSLSLDYSNSLWVLSGGNPSWTGNETKGVLSKINTSTNEVVKTFEFDVTEHPNFLSFDEDNLFYNLNGNVYEMSGGDDALPTTALISDVFAYNMVAKDGLLYATDAADYASNGSLNIYNLSTKMLVNTYPAGIIPGGVYFN